MKIARLTLGACSMALSMGCYSYAPATLDTVPDGTHVEALLSTEGQVVLRDRIGYEQRSVRAELLEQRADVVLFSIQTTTIADEFGSREPLFQRVDVPKSHILRIDQRQMAPLQTGAVVGAAAISAALIVSTAFGDQNPGQPETGGGGPDDHRASGISRLPFSSR